MRSSLHLLAGATILALLAACGGSKGDGAADRDRALARGLELYEARDYEKARLEFRTALQADSTSAEARYQNGRVAERLGDYRAAASFYQGAVEADSTHVRARADLARAFTLGGAPERAMEILEAGLASTPEDVGLLTSRAAARVALRDVPGAFQDAERAYALDPNNPPTIALLAGLYDTNARSDKARALLEAGVRAHPKDGDLRFALAQVYFSLSMPDDAERQYRELVALEPGETSHRLRHAQLLVRQKRVDDAEKVLREALARAPKDRGVRSALVSFLATQRGPAAAEGQLQAFVDAEPAEFQNTLALGAFYVQTGATGKAESLYRNLIAREQTSPGGLAARTQLASVVQARGDVAAASKLLEEVLAANPRDLDALLMRSTILLNRGDAKAAVADLRVVMRDRPDSPLVLRALAKAHAANGEPELANEMLKRAVDAAPGDPHARLDLARALVERGRADQAMALLQPLAKEQPADADTQELLFRTAVALRDVAAARGAAEALLAARPGSPVGHLYAGLVAESERRNEDALRAYDKALELQPDAGEPIRAIVSLLVRTGKPVEALRRLDAHAERAKTNPLPLMLKGELLAKDRRYAEAEAAFRGALERAPKWWVLHRGLALAALGRGDAATAEAVLTRGIPVTDQPQVLRADLAELLEQRGRPDEAARLYEQIIAEAPQLVSAKTRLAVLLATHRADAASLDRAAGLISGFEHATTAPELEAYGWVQLKRGEAAAAVDVLNRALQLAPTSPSIQYRLGVAQLATGDAGRARANLQRAVDGGPRTPVYLDAKAAIDKLAAAP